jgi:hypothetical protein
MYVNIITCVDTHKTYEPLYYKRIQVITLQKPTKRRDSVVLILFRVPKVSGSNIGPQRDAILTEVSVVYFSPSGQTPG